VSFRKKRLLFAFRWLRSVKSQIPLHFRLGPYPR
jgi:hypothetical protein